MRGILAVIGSAVLFTSPAAGDGPFPDGAAPRNLGGLVFIRQNGQTTVSLGGVLFARRVCVRTDTPEGPVLTRFRLPSMLHSPNAVPLPEAAPAQLQVSIPDHHGVLYIDGELVPTRGTVRELQSPLLPPGIDVPVRIRATFKRGDNLLIEDKIVVLHAGAAVGVTFDGSRAVSVPLPPVEELPLPRLAPSQLPPPR